MNQQITPDRLQALKAKIAKYQKLVAKQNQSRRGGLIEFVRYFWHVLEPSTPFVDGWPLEAICRHLEAITFGEIQNLLITVPPGFCKSLITDVFWPAWEWGPMGLAHMRYVAFSYAAHLTQRDNGRFRDLIRSPEYKELYGEGFDIHKSGEQKISNSKTGWKIASSVGGVGTGERGNRVILDDPHSIIEAESEAVRTTTTRWFREAMTNRLNDMATDAIVCIMQRSHYQDVAGVIIEEDFDYVILSIEMEYSTQMERAGMANEIGWVDPRTEEGELAWEGRFPAEVVENLRKKLGPYAYSAQYQQDPVPRGGGILKRAWWMLWDKEEANRYGLRWDPGIKELPHFDLVIGSLDTAYEEKQENNDNAMTVWGVWIDRNQNRRLMLMYAWNKKLDLHGLPVYRIAGEADVNWHQRQRASWGCVEWVAWTCRKFGVQRLLIEGKATGLIVAQEIRKLYARENWGVEIIIPTRDKIARAHSTVPMFADNMVWAPGTRWAETVIEQCERFPKHNADDLVDTVTQVLNWFRVNDLVYRADEAAAELEQEMVYRKPEMPVSEQYGV